MVTQKQNERNLAQMTSFIEYFIYWFQWWFSNFFSYKSIWPVSEIAFVRNLLRQMHLDKRSNVTNFSYQNFFRTQEAFAAQEWKNGTKFYVFAT